ncbi:MAG TPA: MerR family DNA-binding protein [Pseudomonadales bacterium]|nr:MerR family DNA-binding protein [Pseudomonadales bacterium]
MPTVPSLTIGKLAKQAGVGIETVRYYQTRGLMPVPPETGSYRQYPVSLVARIQFIKRAQELGFSLDEIGELLQLDQHTDRKTIRQLASGKIEQIQQKLDDLTRMQTTLQALVASCSHASALQPCPIIVSLSDQAPAN